MTPFRAWLLAARPATLTAAAAPVVVASALAMFDDAFRLDAALIALVAAVAIQVGVNFANDLSDARRGADSAERIGPLRAVASGLISERAMGRGVTTVFGIAVIGGIYLTLIAGPVVVVIGLASILAALGYTGGPSPFGYHGLGEVAVFMFFGPIATVGARFVHDRSAPADAWLISVPVGLLITAILVVNNIRDIETDGAVGKRTLAVLLGRSTTRVLLASLLATALLWTIALVVAGAVPAWVLLGCVAFAEAPRLIRTVSTQVTGPPLITALEGIARLQAVYAALVATGLVVAALVG